MKALEKEQTRGLPEDRAETAARKRDYDLKLKTLRKENSTALINMAENKSRAIWQVINNERRQSNNSKDQTTLHINNRTISDPTEVANCFNNFFATIAEKTLQVNHNNTKQSYENKQPLTNHNLQFTPATSDEVLKAINSLKPKTSSGIDDISAKLTKTCKEELVTPLTNIINKSLNQGIFPEQLKTAKVYPKYKNGPPTDISSYRPISLIPTFSKIFEKIVLERLLLHLEQNRLLTDQQHGFCKGRSTTTALIQFTEYILDQLEKGCVVTSLFLDFSKAFDCLNYNILMQKLRILGINGKASEWFYSYLNDRTQLVEINSTTNNVKQKAWSATTPVQRGVPQGSVLGPVLFLLLTNDLPEWLGDSCHTVMYADDTVLTLCNKSPETLERNANLNFNKSKQYCSSNDLVLNEKKTIQMTFTTNRQTPQIALPNLESKTHTKHLGVTIDSKLSWVPHLDQLCKKLSSGIYVIRRIKQVCGLDTARVAYFALFESHLRYGIATWGGASKTNLERVLVKQKGAIRVLADLHYQDSCRNTFRNMKILTVISLYIREVVLHTVLSEQPRLADVHQYHTRHARNFILPQHHLTLFEKKPSYKGAILFNHLPDHLKEAPPQQLKNQLTIWLQERPFYTVEEFLNS